MIREGKLADVLTTMKLAKVALESVVGSLEELLEMFEHAQEKDVECETLKQRINILIEALAKM